MEKEKAIKIMIALAVVLAAICVLSTTAQMCEAREIKELHIGYQPITHHIAEMTAMEKGWWKRDLERFGIEKVTDTEFLSGPPEMTAMMAGELDVAYVGTAPPISAIDKGLDAKIVAAVNINGSAIVLLPELAANYTSPEDLKGLKIATYPPGSIQDTILKKWLKDNGIDPENDLEIVPMEPGNAITAIDARAVNGVFLATPSPTIIELDGAGKIVVLSGDMWPDHACCCLLASGELIREHPELLEQIIRIHINATEYNVEHMDEAAEIFAGKVGWDVEKVKKSFNRTDMKWIHNPHIEIPSTLEYAKVDYEMGYTDKLLTEDDLFDTRFYDRVTGIAPTPTLSPEVTPAITPSPTPTPGFTVILTVVSLLVAFLFLLFYFIWKNRMKENKILHFVERRGVIELIGICVVIIIWQLVASFIVKETYLLPSPYEVFLAFYKVRELIPGDIYVSLLHFGIGLGAGAVVGITLGALMGWFKMVYRAIDPIMEILRAIPPIAWIPFAIIWLKLTYYSAGFVVFIGAVFPIMLNTYTGFRGVDKIYIDAAKVLGCKKGTDLIKSVLLPYSLPYIAAGIRIGMGVGWMCVVAAEMFGASKEGLGFRLWSEFYDLHMMDKLVAYMIIIGLIALLLDRVFMYFVRKSRFSGERG